MCGNWREWSGGLAAGGRVPKSTVGRDWAVPGACWASWEEGSQGGRAELSPCTLWAATLGWAGEGHRGTWGRLQP